MKVGVLHIIITEIIKIGQELLSGFLFYSVKAAQGTPNAKKNSIINEVYMLVCVSERVCTCLVCE